MSDTSRIRFAPCRDEARGDITGKEMDRLVPRRCTLHGFAQEIASLGGLDVRELDPITPLQVHTENTCYRITVVEPRGLRILVQGGAFFPTATPAQLEGSSFGGSLLKQGWIGPGLRMEIFSDGNRVVTSKVQSLGVEGDDALPGPF